MEDPLAPAQPAVDPLVEALVLIESGRAGGVPLRLVGGLAVRVLCPDFPPRARKGQDLDLASVSRTRPRLTQLLVEQGYEADKRFNALYGHKQLYFRSPQGRTVDVLVDQVAMCHDLAFKDRIERMPLTLDVTDLLLTKLQIVELNQKDAQDAVYLLAAYPVREGDEPGTIGLQRVREIVSDDWGWWRTVTHNLTRIEQLAGDAGAAIVPAAATRDVIAQLRLVASAAETVPKSLRWKVRARVGERKRWYRVPQEDTHD
jgi:hypothetical protein